MRSLPRPARVAVAALYVRMRDARSHHANLLRTQCPDSPAGIASRARFLETHNALQVVLGHLHGGEPKFTSPREMLRLTALRGRAFARARGIAQPDLTEAEARDILKAREPDYDPRWNVEVEGRTITWCEGDHHRSQDCDYNTITA